MIQVSCKKLFTFLKPQSELKISEIILNRVLNISGYEEDPFGNRGQNSQLS